MNGYWYNGVWYPQGQGPMPHYAPYVITSKWGVRLLVLMIFGIPLGLGIASALIP